MPTNYRIELKICMDTYFHPSNAMMASEFWYFDSLKAKTYRDVKYEVIFYKIAQKFIQMMLEYQQMIGLS